MELETHCWKEKCFEIFGKVGLHRSKGETLLLQQTVSSLKSDGDFAAS
jgi:hypothetical protein